MVLKRGLSLVPLSDFQQIFYGKGALGKPNGDFVRGLICTHIYHNIWHVSHNHLINTFIKPWTPEEQQQIYYCKIIHQQS